MTGSDIFTLDLGIEPPWQIVSQHLDTGKEPHELRIELASERGGQFPCPEFGVLCKAHDFSEHTWRHLNFFQHHCYITARLPRVDCPQHGVRKINAPWAR